MTSAHNFQKTYLRWLQGRSSTMRTTAQKFKAVDLPSSVSEDWVIYVAHLWNGSSWAVTVKCSKDSTDEICLNDLTKSLTNWATPSWNSPATVPRLLDTVSNVATGSVVSNRSVLSPFSRKRLCTRTTGTNDSSCRSHNSWRRNKHKSEKDSSLVEYTRADRMSRSLFSIDLSHVSASSVKSELALTHCIKRLLWLHCKVFKIWILTKTHVTLPWEHGVSIQLQKILTSSV